MRIQLIRHATHIISYQGKRLLLDPMFSEKGTLSPVPNAPNQHLNNPLTELPVEIQQLVDIDGIIVTHIHRDHFDDTAISSLPKNLPLFCQPEDMEFIQSKGFERVIEIDKGYCWENIKFTRTPGRHGRGELAEKMGPVSGFVLEAEQEPTLYIIGDSVWYSEIEEVLKEHKPKYAIVFAGEAQYLEGDPITMGLGDIDSIMKINPEVNLIVSHMEAWNHCVLTRSEVRNYIAETHLEQKIWLPENGEVREFR